MSLVANAGHTTQTKKQTNKHTQTHTPHTRDHTNGRARANAGSGWRRGWFGGPWTATPGTPTTCGRYLNHTYNDNHNCKNCSCNYYHDNINIYIYAAAVLFVGLCRDRRHNQRFCELFCCDTVGYIFCLFVVVVVAVIIFNYIAAVTIVTSWIFVAIIFIIKYNHKI